VRREPFAGTGTKYTLQGPRFETPDGAQTTYEEPRRAILSDCNGAPFYSGYEGRVGNSVEPDLFGESD
jgi:hypothetical protein